jgi:sphingomyelin phosphodiesterase
MKGLLGTIWTALPHTTGKEAILGGPQSSAFISFVGIVIVAWYVLDWIWLWRLERYYVRVVRHNLARANAESKLLQTTRVRQTVRLLSYNIFIRPPGVSARGEDFKDERLARLLGHIIRRDLDIVALQELFRFGSPRRRAFVRAARRLGGYRYEAALPYPPPWWILPPRVLDGGVTILSRFPIERVVSMTYRAAHWHYIDSIVAKGVLCAHVRIPLRSGSASIGTMPTTTTLAVFATHAQAGNAAYPGVQRIRRKQIKQLRTLVERETNNGTLPAVICGDLNVNGMNGAHADCDASEYTDMLSILNGDAALPSASAKPLQFRDVLKDAYHGHHPITVDAVTAAGEPREPLLYPIGSRKQPKRLDYVLCDPGPNAKLVIKHARVDPFILDDWDAAPFRQLSDHDALLVEMEFLASSSGHVETGS